MLSTAISAHPIHIKAQLLMYRSPDLDASSLPPPPIMLLSQLFCHYLCLSPLDLSHHYIRSPFAPVSSLHIKLVADTCLTISSISGKPKQMLLHVECCLLLSVMDTKYLPTSFSFIYRSRNT